MAKKTNKTEQVLKLIATEESDAVKADSATDSAFDILHPEKGQTYLVNLTEFLVRDWVDEILKKMGVCDCEVCKNDTIALALNDLKNKFVTSNTGKLHVQLEVYKKQYETDVIAALTKACVRVKASPRHEAKEKS
ncbi:MAG: late competence development ComFB family protein [Anaerovoracaceae bacterium]|jgi:competence protein ComFB